MKVMVMVKATKESEAGIMPTQELLTEMGKFNEELVKAGIMFAGEGLHPSSKGARRPLFRQKPNRDQRPLHRNQRARGRFLALAGEVDGGSHRVGQTLP